MPDLRQQYINITNTWALDNTIFWPLWLWPPDDMDEVIRSVLSKMYSQALSQRKLGMLLEEAWNCKLPQITPLTPWTANQSQLQPASRPIRLQAVPRGNIPRQLFPDLTETDVVSFFPRTVSAHASKSSLSTCYRNMSLPEKRFFRKRTWKNTVSRTREQGCVFCWLDLKAEVYVVPPQIWQKTSKPVLWHCAAL